MNVNDVRRLNIGNRKIEKLVHDSTFLYWINRDNKDDIVIERYNLSNHNSDPSVIVHFANSVTGMYILVLIARDTYIDVYVM